MKLYTYFRSSAAYRVRIALNLKGLSYQAVPVHLLKNGGEQHQDDYLRINPSGLLPLSSSPTEPRVPSPEPRHCQRRSCPD